MPQSILTAVEKIMGFPRDEQTIFQINGVAPGSDIHTNLFSYEELNFKESPTVTIGILIPKLSLSGLFRYLIAFK